MKSFIISLQLIVFTTFISNLLTAQPNVNSTTLSKTDAANLIKMREEEKLAHDVYKYMAEKWDHQVFKNILQSEKMHGNMIKELLDYYQINDPYKEEDGKFQDVLMQNLYTDLITKGSESLQQAFWVGATIEDLDIADLEKIIAATSQQKIVEVYEELNRGSRNHIRAFTRQMNRLDVNYTPKYISAERYATILKTDHEEGKLCHDKNVGKESSSTKSCAGKKGSNTSCMSDKKCCSNTKNNKKNCNH